MALMPAMNGVVPYVLRMYGPTGQRSVAVATAVTGTKCAPPGLDAVQGVHPACAALLAIVTILLRTHPPAWKHQAYVHARTPDSKPPSWQVLHPPETPTLIVGLGRGAGVGQSCALIRVGSTSG